MKKFKMRLIAVSEKDVTISAECAKEAAEMVEKMYLQTNALDFSNEDVAEVTIMRCETDINEILNYEHQTSDNNMDECL